MTVLDLGFYEAFDRPFNPLTDPGYLGSGLDLLHASAGSRRADRGPRSGSLLALVAGAALLRVVGAAHAAYGPGRTAGVEPRGRRARPRLAGAGVGGAQVERRPGRGRTAASLVAGQVDQVRAELRDRAVFDQALTHDRYALTPGHDLLTRLRGKDVLVVFVESYGRVAVEDSWFAPQVDRTLDRADRAPRPTRVPRPQRLAGLAHLRRDQLARPLHAPVRALDRLPAALRPGARQRPAHPRLRRSRRPAGGPSATSRPTRTPGPRASGSTTTTGCTAPTTWGTPARAWATRGSPTSTPCSAFDDLELQPHRRPGDGRDRPRLEPHPLDPAAPAGAVGHASATARSTTACTSAGVTSSLSTLRPPPRPAGPLRPVDPLLAAVAGRVRAPRPRQEPGHGRARRPPAALAAVSGNGASHDVPISLIAHDPAVLRQISGWGWTPGLQPATDDPDGADERVPRPVPRGVRLAPHGPDRTEPNRTAVRSCLHVRARTGPGSERAP